MISYRRFRVFDALFVERFRTEPRKIDTSVDTYLGEIVLMSLDIDQLVMYPRRAN
jgi:hypothetical protein